MAEHELWSFSNALFFLILLILIIFIVIFGFSTIFDVRKVKANWAEQRCSPMIMPFASLFGYNTKENFEFCMGKIFQTHSMSYFSSISGMFSHFTALLTMLFDAISSIRNIIASLGGGINVVFQEFTERISTFFFKLRVSAITIKMLIGRMYAILFSVMYMGLSGITGMTSFTNTFLFSFLDTFCFPEDTKLLVESKGQTPIKDIKIGDVLLPTKSKVTGTFQFYSKGQPMVKLGNTTVSTNHYVKYQDKYIKAGNHPLAQTQGTWQSDKPLYCLNTHDNKIPIDNLIFLDYDETTEGDVDTMNYIQERINAKKNMENTQPTFKEYSPAVSGETLIKTLQGSKKASEIKIGDKLVTGSEVVGLIQRRITQVCKLDNGLIITPSTLVWSTTNNIWERCGEQNKIIDESRDLVSFVVVPNSQIELEDGKRIRDYMELCSPDSEIHYSTRLEETKICA